MMMNSDRNVSVKDGKFQDEWHNDAMLEAARALDEEPLLTEEYMTLAPRLRVTWLGLVALASVIACLVLLLPSSPFELMRANPNGAIRLSTDSDDAASVAGWSSSPVFVAAFGYTGTRQITGKFIIRTSTAIPFKQTFEYSIIGVPTEDECTTAASTYASACTFRVHDGTSCTTAQGMDRYDSDLGANPWDTVPQYQFAYGATDAAGTIEVTTGLISVQLETHVLIVYDETGTAAACSLVEHQYEDPERASWINTTHAQTVGYSKSPAFVPYFDYKGSYVASGTMSLLTTDSAPYSQKIVYKLTGLPSKELCSSDKAAITSNACEFHIHVGKSCEKDALAHYYASELTVDPWASTTRYYNNGVSLATGEAWGETKVATSLTSEKIEGHAMIIHDETGAKIACSIVTRASGIASCLPGDAVVKLEGRGSVPMESVSTGDYVLVESASGELIYEPVVGFLHILERAPKSMDRSQFVSQAS